MEPIYLRAKGKKYTRDEKSYSILCDKILLSDNVESALQQFFNLPPEGNNTTVTDNNIKNSNSEKIKAAKDLYDKALESQKSEDWSKYGEYIKQLGDQLSSLE